MAADLEKAASGACGHFVGNHTILRMEEEELKMENFEGLWFEEGNQDLRIPTCRTFFVVDYAILRAL